MNFEFAQPATAAQLFNRMTMKEFFAIHRADTEDQLEYMRQNDFGSDGGPPNKTIMKELKKMATIKFKMLEERWGPENAQRKKNAS